MIVIISALAIFRIGLIRVYNNHVSSSLLQKATLAVKGTSLEKKSNFVLCDPIIAIDKIRIVTLIVIKHAID